MVEMFWDAKIHGGSDRVKSVAPDRVSEYEGYGWTVRNGADSVSVSAPDSVQPETVIIKPATTQSINTSLKQRGRPKKWK